MPQPTEPLRNEVRIAAPPEIVFKRACTAIMDAWEARMLELASV